MLRRGLDVVRKFKTRLITDPKDIEFAHSFAQFLGTEQGRRLSFEILSQLFVGYEKDYKGRLRAVHIDTSGIVINEPEPDANRVRLVFNDEG